MNTAEMRTRTRDLDEVLECWENRTTYSCDTSAPSFWDWGTKEAVVPYFNGYAANSGNEVMVDWVHSNYKSRVMSGEVINNPLTQTKTLNVDVPAQRIRGYYKYQPVVSIYPPQPVPIYKRGWIVDGTIPSSVYLGSPSADLTWSLDIPDVNADQDLIDRVVTDAYARIDTSEVASLVSIGEARETVKFLFDSGRRLVKIYKALRHLNFRALKKEITFNEFAKRYLEYRYAIRPLISEADQYFRATFIGKSYAHRMTYRAKDNVLWEGSADPYLCYNGQYGTFTAQETASVEVLVRAGVLCSLDLSKIDKWGKNLILESALDLIPLSFIADWFFNISNTLAAHTPEAGVKQLASWYSVLKEENRIKRVIDATVKESLYVNNVTYDHVLNSISGCKIQRTVTTKIRTPNPVLRTWPQMKLRLNAWKLLDIGLILKQLISIPAQQTFVKRRKIQTIYIDGKTLVW